MIKKLPDICKDCASYGSEFCEECLEELVKDLPAEERPVFNKALQNLAKAIVSESNTNDENLYKSVDSDSN
mgnify:CR=1 FL=1